jgi:hypothetical protein
LCLASSMISGHSKEKFLAMNRVSAISFGSKRLGDLHYLVLKGIKPIVVGFLWHTKTSLLNL